MRARRGGWIPLIVVVPAFTLSGCLRPETRQAEPEIHVGIGARLTAAADPTDGAALANSRESASENAPEIATESASDAAAGAIRPTAAIDPFGNVEDAKIALSPPNSPAALASVSGLRLTLDEAIATSLDRNPTLVALRASDPVAVAALHVAETYPFNPYVQIEVLPYNLEIEGFQGAVTHYVLLMQTLELAHQQRYRESSAAASLNQVRWNIIQAELLNSAATERLYFTALYQRELRDLARQTAALNEELRNVVERRYRANLSKAADVTTADVAARQSHKQAALVEANYQTALLALKRQLNVENDQPIALVGRLEDFSWHPVGGIEPSRAPDSESIHVSRQFAAELAAERPDVRAAQSGTSMAQANADLARANMVQSIQFGPFYERDDFGTVFLGFRAQTNIPVFDTGRPLCRQREAELAQQAITLDQLRARAEIEIQTAVERYERARRLVAHERSEAFRSIPEQLQRIKDEFAAGQAEILNVFAVQNSLLQERKTYLDLLNELAQAASDVTLTAGLPPARVISGNPELPDLPPLP